jgi:hypothetical protein
MADKNQQRVDGECFLRAKLRGDCTFTLVGQDISSTVVVCEWIKQNIETAPEEKLREALEFCLYARTKKNRKPAD